MTSGKSALLLSVLVRAELRAREQGQAALRQCAQQALRESERKYRELVELANSIILRWTRDGRIIFLNEFGLRFFGYAEAEIRGRHVIGTLVPEAESSGRDLSSLMDEICANGRAGRRQAGRLRHRPADAPRTKGFPWAA